MQSSRFIFGISVLVAVPPWSVEETSAQPGAILNGPQRAGGWPMERPTSTNSQATVFASNGR
jgi:hypothetical protein